MVTLSITSCKRLHLFEKTVKSFYANCEDNSSISHVYYFDDSSSDEDRLKMGNDVNGFVILEKDLKKYL